MDSVLSPLLLELQTFSEPAPRPAFFRTPACSPGQQSKRNVRVPTTSPSHSQRERRGPACYWQVIVPRQRLSNPVSFRYTLRALHPHSWNVRLPSFTFRGPQFNNMSSSFRLTQS